MFWFIVHMFLMAIVNFFKQWFFHHG